MSRYVITRHVGLEGVALAKRGHWGGRRFDDEAAAERAAREDAKGAAEIERETVR